MAEGYGCSFCEKQSFVIQQLLPQRRNDHILVGIQTEDFDRIRIAVQDQFDELIERIYDCIGIPVFILFKLCKSDQVRRLIQRNSPKVNIAVFTVCSIPVAAADSQQHDPAAEPRMFPDKIIFCGIYD